jgi:3-hydroxybutyryl-CoA dehydratase
MLDKADGGSEMTTIERSANREVGDLLIGWERTLTSERVLWYGDGLMSSAANERVRARSNIHTDAEFARSQGLPGAIVDGMHSTNWISSMLVREFGRDYLERGELRTKYIKPIYVGTFVSVRGRITSREATEAGGVRYELDVWVEDPKGQQLTVGDAAIEVAG